MLHTQPREGAYLSAYQPTAYLLSAARSEPILPIGRNWMLFAQC
ncbi:hypothetical protein ALO36_104083 [Pseudomonas syringae pv. tomato]|nr:Unknown protein sequence [Pseudomonas syringae pv. maculicola]KPC10539.1 Unknown protein sequence [Pseudomonas amygdali pv. lachrymans]KPY87160.1 hypothetical protein ALO36_104083 [Pseudomonas syringae pv. tomato]RMM12261.1 hypothetical protein ALQ85_102653 [Pseudomonas syringae]